LRWKRACALLSVKAAKPSALALLPKSLLKLLKKIV
jgi:hypothetical protein